MDDNKTQDLLLRLLQDMSYVKAKLDNIDEQRLGSRIDALEASNKEYGRALSSLEKRLETQEEIVRNQMIESKKQQTSIFISLGMAVFSAILSFIINLL